MRFVQRTLWTSVLVSAWAVAPLLAQPATEPVVVIHAGALLDRPGQAPRGPSTIIVRGGRIEAVRDGHVAPPDGARLIDLKGQFVLPGLIDAHVHIFADDDKMRQRLEVLNRDIEDTLLIGVDNARRTLEAGFTTVRDLGSDVHSVTALRDGIASGLIAGPTIVAAGFGISGTGGHADAANNVSRDIEELRRSRATNTCNGADDCRRAVRRQISQGADVIKFTATGGVNSNIAGGLNQQLFDDEMKAIVDTARLFGRKVAAHAHGADGIAAALRAGVDSVEHATYTNAETNALFKRSNAWLVPTMVAPHAALAQARAGARSKATLAKAEEAVAVHNDNIAKAIRDGVRIAFGTDSGVSDHGKNAREFALLIKAGMTPAAAIRAATVDAATLLDRSEPDRLHRARQAGGHHRRGDQPAGRRDRARTRALRDAPGRGPRARRRPAAVSAALRGPVKARGTDERRSRSPIASAHRDDGVSPSGHASRAVDRHRTVPARARSLSTGRGLPGEACSCPRWESASSIEGRIVGLGMAGERAVGSGDWATLEDAFDIASCSKSVTATIAAMLVEQSKARWDMTFSEVFPELRSSIHPGYAGATLELLLRHRAGLDHEMNRNDRWAGWQREHSGDSPTEQRLAFTKAALQRPPRSAPGAETFYTSDGYIVAGSMLERLAGLDWEQLVRTQLFEPLELRSMRYGVATQVSGHEAGLVRPVDRHRTRSGRIWPPAVRGSGGLPALLGARPAALRRLPHPGRARTRPAPAAVVIRASAPRGRHGAIRAGLGDRRAAR